MRLMGEVVAVENALVAGGVVGWLRNYSTWPGVDAVRFDFGLTSV
jgi:hypothetical protein